MDRIKFGDRFPSGSRFVDGVGIDVADSMVLRERVHLAEDGLITIVVTLDELSVTLKSIKIVTKGLVLEDHFVKELKANLTNALNQLDLRIVKNEDELNGIIRKSIKNFVFRNIKKNPMILPIIMVV